MRSFPQYYLTCTYCKGALRLATIRVKRKAPPGAKDLNLFDEKRVMKCVKCEVTQKVSADVKPCKCGATTGPLPELNTRIELEPQDIYALDACTKCYKCPICNGALGKDYVLEEATFIVKRHREEDSHYVQYFYFHRLCVEKHPQAASKTVQQWTDRHQTIQDQVDNEYEKARRSEEEYWALRDKGRKRQAAEWKRQGKCTACGGYRSDSSFLLRVQGDFRCERCRKKGQTHAY